MLMLLATYGLRAGEIVALRLQDLDWRRDVLHVRHSKTGIPLNYRYCAHQVKRS
jgi:integrase/recombinase XerD